MNNIQAVHSFWNSFGISAYLNTNVPDKAKFPFITYELKTGGFAESVDITVGLWDYGSSESSINKLVEQISSTLKDGGKVIHCDEGALWIKKASPFAIALRDETDSSIRHRQLNIIIEFFTN